MKNQIAAIAFLALTGCSALQPRETNIAVGAVLDELQIAINEIDARTQGSSLPPFKNAEVILSTKGVQTGEASASLVLSGEGRKSTTQSNTLTLVLGPSRTKTLTCKPSTGTQLADYVVAAVTAIDAKKFLELQRLVVEAGFDVTVDAAGGIKIEVASVSVGGKASRSSTDSHTLKLIFEKPEKTKP